MTDGLIRLLGIVPGITALIGGGGKTTLLYTLTESLRRQGTVIVCTSTHIRRPEGYSVVTDGDADRVSALLSAEGAVCVGTPAENGKLCAPRLSFDELRGLADYVLVEADGSRGLPLKAHASHEPVIPACAARTVLVVGIDGIGRSIREACHRPERYAQLAGAEPEEAVPPAMAARVIRTEGFGDAVLINKVEGAERQAAAEELAAMLSVPVVTGSLHKEAYRCLC